MRGQRRCRTRFLNFFLNLRQRKSNLMHRSFTEVPRMVMHAPLSMMTVPICNLCFRQLLILCLLHRLKSQRILGCWFPMSTGPTMWEESASERYYQEVSRWGILFGVSEMNRILFGGRFQRFLSIPPWLLRTQVKA